MDVGGIFGLLRCPRAGLPYISGYVGTDRFVSRLYLKLRDHAVTHTQGVNEIFLLCSNDW